MTREIILSNGGIALVDPEDFEWLSQFRWTENTGGYAYRSVKSDEQANPERLMHRAILRPPRKMVVDHINRNKLDNRRCNIRVCTYSQNAQSRIARARQSTSTYKGVIWVPNLNRWIAQIGSRRTHLGLFTDEIEAARAYDRAARRLAGEFARLNFPDDE